MREYGQISAKTLGEMRKNARQRTAEKLQVASPAPLLLHATFQGERYARYARRIQKNTQNPLCASPFKAKISAKLRLLGRQLNPPYGRRISPENNDLMQISAHASLFVPYRQAQNPAERKTLSQ